MLVLVFDNGSTDGTQLILNELAKDDERLQVDLAHKNIGTTVSRNSLFHKLPDDVDYVCVLDSDTVVNRAAMDTLMEALATHPSVGVVGPTMANSAGVRQLSGRNLPSLGIKLGKVCLIPSVRRRAEEREVPAESHKDGLKDVGYLLSACWLMPRRVLNDVGMLDENIFYAPEDVDWCVRARARGWRVCYCPEAHIIHEYQRLSRKRFVSKINWEHLKGLAYYFRKHGYLFDASKAK